MAPVSIGFLVVSAVLARIGTELGDTQDITWVVSGFSIASALGFTIAGRLGDIFGRRYVIVAGQAITVIAVVSVSSTTPL